MLITPRKEKSPECIYPHAVEEGSPPQPCKLAPTRWVAVRCPPPQFTYNPTYGRRGKLIVSSESRASLQWGSFKDIPPMPATVVCCDVYGICGIHGHTEPPEINTMIGSKLCCHHLLCYLPCSRHARYIKGRVLGLCAAVASTLPPIVIQVSIPVKAYARVRTEGIYFVQNLPWWLIYIVVWICMYTEYVSIYPQIFEGV